MSVTGTIPVGAAPWGVATNGTSTAYVSNNGANSVSVINLASRAVTATIAVGGAPAQLALSGTRLFVANNASGNMSVIDTTSNTVVDTLPAGTQPWGVTSYGGAVFVANYGAGNVYAFDAASGRQTATIVTGGTPFGLSAGVNKLVITDTSGGSMKAVPLVAPTPAPTWSSNTKKRSVTAVDPYMQGVTYAITATNGSTTKKGSCKIATSKVTCTISSLPKGKTWKLNLTTKLPWQATAGGSQNKKYKF